MNFYMQEIEVVRGLFVDMWNSLILGHRMNFQMQEIEGVRGLFVDMWSSLTLGNRTNFKCRILSVSSIHLWMHGTPRFWGTGKLDVYTLWSLGVSVTPMFKAVMK